MRCGRRQSGQRRRRQCWCVRVVGTWTTHYLTSASAALRPSRSAFASANLASRPPTMTTLAPLVAKPLAMYRPISAMRTYKSLTNACPRPSYQDMLALDSKQTAQCKVLCAVSHCEWWSTLLSTSRISVSVARWRALVWPLCPPPRPDHASSARGYHLADATHARASSRQSRVGSDILSLV